MSAEGNHKCIWCQERYDACDKCTKVNNWRAIACSPDCFQKYMTFQEEKEKEAMMPVKEENTVIPDVIKPVSEIKTDIMESKPKTK